ncbi:MAG: sugar phosphate isomerase/epimerase [Clostridia bacterium]|nr:sugar phosphate isomerase/epimerase [Clostridia bacterium]
MKLSLTLSALNLISSEPQTALDAVPCDTFTHFDLSLNYFFKNGSDDYLRDSMADALAETAQRRKFEFVTSHAPYRYNACQSEESFEKQVEEIKAALKLCARFGIDRTTVHAGYGFSADRADMMQKNARYFRSLLPTAEACGVILMIENISEPIYNRPFVIETAENILELRRILGDHPLIGACWDTGHANMIALDQYENIINLRGILKGVHLQDNNGDRDDHMPPLMGNINFNDVVKGLIDIGYDGAFNLETHLLRPGKERPDYCCPFNGTAKVQPRLFASDADLVRYGVGVTYHLGRYIMAKHGLPIE